MEWFRLNNEALHDRKLRRMPVSSRWVWAAVLAQANLRAPDAPVVLFADLVAAGEGLVLLTGGMDGTRGMGGTLARLVRAGRTQEAEAVARRYAETFGAERGRERVFVEVHQQRLPERAGLQDGLVAAGQVVRVAGWAISAQRPPTAKGMGFVVLEDETGRLPVALPPQVASEIHRVLRSARVALLGTTRRDRSVAQVLGRVERVGWYRALLGVRMWGRGDGE